MFPWFWPIACWDVLSHPAAPSRKSGYWKCKDGCFLVDDEMVTFCLRLVDSVFALKGNLLILLQRYQRLTDWPSFEFWIWLLLITLFKSCMFVLRVTTAGIVSVAVYSRLGWDWNHHRPVKPHIRPEAAWCFCLLENTLLSLLLLVWGWAHSGQRSHASKWCFRGSHRVNDHGITTSLTETWQSAVM